MRDFYTKENMQGESFHIPDGGLTFEPAELSFETEAETGREGVIRVRHTGGRAARGYVYPSERCMRGVREQFAPAADGTGYIRWQFDSRGIAPGRTVSGYFRVISPFGEYKIPYTVKVSGAGEPSRKKGVSGRGGAEPSGVRTLQRRGVSSSLGGAASLTQESAHNTRKNVDFTRKNVDLTRKNIDITRKNVDSARKNADSTRKNVDFSRKNADSARKNVDFTLSGEEEAAFSDIRSKADFLALAGRDFELAADFFYSNRFARILTDEKDRTLYRGLSMQKNNMQNVEEFLIAACGRKKTIFEPVEKSLFLKTEGRAGRADSRMAGTRAERALEAHRQRVRSRGLGVTPVKQQTPPQDDLIYIPLRIKKTGTGHLGLTIQAEGRFLPSAPFDVPAEFPGMQDAAGGDNASASDMEGGASPAGNSIENSIKNSIKNSIEVHKPEADVESGISGTDSGASGKSALAAVFGRMESGEPERIFTVRIPVNTAALHAGRNFGRIIVKGPFNESFVSVEVHCTPSAPPVRRRQERELHVFELQLMRLYVDYRLTETRAHADLEMQADRLIDEISRRSHRDLIPRLYRVHMLILRGQNAEAEKELSRIAIRYAGTDGAQNFSARFTAEQEDAYCYRQYLYARSREDDVQLRSKVVRFLKGVYRAKNNWQTAWMLMDLAEEYAPGTGARWNFLRHQYENGCNSPAIWIDAWEMVREDPRILLPGSSVQERWVKDDFGLIVLWYAARNNVLTEKAAEIMVSLAEKKKNFSPLLYKALCAAVEVEGLANMKDQLLRAICILLIRGQDISPKAHSWYVRALENSVILTNLEEYCQRSTPPDDSGFRLPPGCNSILRTTASRARMAVLIYDRFRQEQVFPIKGGAASMSVYGDANTIFLEDEEGNRYAVSLPFVLDFQESGQENNPDSAHENGLKISPASARQNGQAGELRNGWNGLNLISEKRAYSDNPYELALQIGYGDREKALVELNEDTAAAAGKLLDSGFLTSAARTELLLMCLDACRKPAVMNLAGADYNTEKTSAAERSESADRQGRSGRTGADYTAEKTSAAEKTAAAGRSESADRQGRSGRTGVFENKSENDASAGNPEMVEAGMASDRSEEFTRFFLKKADPMQCSPNERALLLRYLEEAGEYERAVTWLLAFGNDAVDARLLGKISLGLPWEGGYETAVVPIGWEAFLHGNTDPYLLEKLSETLPGLTEELCSLRRVCAENAVSTRKLDNRIVRQTLYSGALSREHAQIIVSEGERLGDVFLPALGQYSDFAFSGGISLGNRMTELVAKTIAEERGPIEDICRIAFLKELSIRQGEFSEREKAAVSASLAVLLSKGIIFPFYRQFPGYDDRLDLYAEETLVQYHSLSRGGGKEKRVLFHYTTSRRGEIGNYRSRPMKEMYRNFYVSGFLLFYGEQMHYYITDDPQEKHVVQSGMIGQDARILENCSGRFGLINETTRAAALRDYDEALSLLTGYYRRSYLESELFRH